MIYETGPVEGAGNDESGVNGYEKVKDNELESERTLKGSEEKAPGEPADDEESRMTLQEAKAALKQLPKLTKPNQEQYQV